MFRHSKMPTAYPKPPYKSKDRAKPNIQEQLTEDQSAKRTRKPKTSKQKNQETLDSFREKRFNAKQKNRKLDKSSESEAVAMETKDEKKPVEKKPKPEKDGDGTYKNPLSESQHQRLIRENKDNNDWWQDLIQKNSVSYQFIDTIDITEDESSPETKIVSKPTCYTKHFWHTTKDGKKALLAYSCWLTPIHHPCPESHSSESQDDRYVAEQKAKQNDPMGYHLRTSYIFNNKLPGVKMILVSRLDEVTVRGPLVQYDLLVRDVTYQFEDKSKPCQGELVSVYAGNKIKAKEATQLFYNSYFGFFNRESTLIVDDSALLYHNGKEYEFKVPLRLLFPVIKDSRLDYYEDDIFTGCDVSLEEEKLQTDFYGVLDQNQKRRREKIEKLRNFSLTDWLQGLEFEQNVLDKQPENKHEQKHTLEHQKAADVLKQLMAKYTQAKTVNELGKAIYADSNAHAKQQLQQQKGRKKITPRPSPDLIAFSQLLHDGIRIDEAGLTEKGKKLLSRSDSSRFKSKFMTGFRDCVNELLWKSYIRKVTPRAKPMEVSESSNSSSNPLRVR